MSTIELPEADASKTEQTQARPEDPLGFNDNDSDKTDGNQAAVKEYEVKIEKLTSLVSKMKKALELQTNKTNEKNKDIERLQAEKKDLEELVEKFVKEENDSHVNWEAVKEISARVSVMSTVWCCIKTDHAITWKREDSISTSQSDKQNYSQFNRPRLVDYVETLKKIDEDDKKIKDLEKQMMEVIRQYEERVQKMRVLVEESEKKSKQTINELKSKQLDRETLTTLLNSVIDESSEIRENSLIYLNDETDNTTKEESLSKMKIYLYNLKKKDLNSDFPILNDLRNHLLLLHETLFDTLRKLSSAESDLFRAEKNWKKTIDNLIHEIEKEKKDKLELVDVGRRKMKDLESTIDSIKIEAQKAVKERDLQIEFLSQELKKNANTQYIKNILLNFMTNTDLTVREKLIPVLGTVLQFTSNELESAKTAWQNDHKSILGKSWITSKIMNNIPGASK